MACNTANRLADNYIKKTLSEVNTKYKERYGKTLNLSNGSGFLIADSTERAFLIDLLDSAQNNVLRDAEDNPIQIDLFTIAGAGIKILYDVSLIADSLEQSMQGSTTRIDYANRNSKAYKNLTQEKLEQQFSGKQKVLDEFIKTSIENLQKVTSIPSLKKILKGDIENKEVSALYNIKKSLETEIVSGDFFTKVKALTHYILQAEVLSGEVVNTILELDLTGKERFIHIKELYELVAGTRGTIESLREEFKYLPKENNPLTFLIANTLDNIGRIEALLTSEAEKFGLDEYEGIHSNNIDVMVKKIKSDIVKFTDLSKNSIDSITRNKASERVRDLTEQLDRIPKKSRLKDVLTGKAGDIGYWKTAIRAAIANADPIVSGFAAKVKEIMSKTDRVLNEVRNDFESQIELLRKNTNISFVTPENSFNDMLDVHKTYSHVTGEDTPARTNSEVENFIKQNSNEAYYLLHNIDSSYYEQKSMLLSKREYWNELVRGTDKKDINYKKYLINYLSAKKEYRAFATKYMERKYTPDFYEAENNLDQFIDGIHVRGYYTKYDDDMKRIRDEVTISQNGRQTSSQSNELAHLYRTKSQLRSVKYQETQRDKALSLAPEQADFINRYYSTRIKLAEALTKFHTLDKARFNRTSSPEIKARWEENKKDIDNTVALAKRELANRVISKEEFDRIKDQRDTWYVNNVISTATDSWNSRRDELWKEKDLAEQKIRDITGVTEEQTFSEKHETRKVIARAYRDSSRIVDGTIMLDAELAEVKRLDIELSSEAGYLDKILNFPPAYYTLVEERKSLQLAKLAKKLQAKSTGYPENIEDEIADLKRVRIEIDLLKTAHFNANPNLKVLVDEYNIANRELFNIQTSTVTPYYTEEKEKQFSLFLDSKKDEDLPAEFIRGGVTYSYREGAYYMNSEIHNEELYTGTIEGLNLLMYKDEFELSSWWQSNHIFKERYVEEDNMFEQYWEPTYAWRHVVPNRAEDRVLESPAFHWTKKEVKPEFVNSKFESSKDATGKPGLKEQYYKERGSKFYSNKYHSLDRHRKSYLDWITQQYFKAQTNHPEKKRNGYMIPSIDRELGIDSYDSSRKGELLRTMGSQVKRNFISTAQDIDEGDPTNSTSLGSTEGRIVKHRPIYYSNKIDILDVSKNIHNTILKYVDASNKYKIIGEELTPLYEATKIVLEKNPPKSSSYDAVSKSVARKIERKTGEIMGVRKLTNKEQSNNRLKVIEELYDMWGYGVMSRRPEEKTWFEKKTGLDLFKTQKTLLGAKSFATLASNPLSGHAVFGQVGNQGNGMIQQLISTAVKSGDTNFTVSQWFSSYKEFYGRHIKDLVKDWNEGKTGNKTMFSQMIDNFGVIEGEVRNRAGNNIKNKSHLRKLLTSDWLFVTRNAAEITLASTTFLAFGKNYMVKHQGKSIPIIEAYEMKEGILSLKEGVRFPNVTDEQYNNYIEALSVGDKLAINEYLQIGEQVFKDKLQNLLRRINGTYGTYDKTLIERFWWGASIMWMRKWLESIFRVRYGANQYSYEEADFVEGYWRTTGKLYLENLVDLIKNREKHDPRLWNIFRNPESLEYLSDREKDALRQMKREVLLIGALAVFISLVLGYNEEEEDRFKKMKKNGDLYWFSWLNNWAIYGFLKMNAEAQGAVFPVGLDEIKKVYNHPFQQLLPFLDDVTSIAFGDINYTSWIKEGVGIIDKSDPFFKVYKVSSGVHEKGDIKAVAKMLKLIGMTSSKMDHTAVEAIKNIERSKQR